MPRVIRGAASQVDGEPPTGVERDSVAGHVEVDRQQASGAYEEVVREDGVDPADAAATLPDEAIASLRFHGQGRFAHAAASLTATLTAPGSRVTSTGTLPKGSPSRCTRVAAVPSIRTVRAWTISTFGFFRCLAW